MRYLLLLALFSAFAKTAHAQHNPAFEAGEKMDPRVTEQYLDVPIVSVPATSAEAQMYAFSAPSDAEILFSGGDLSAWSKPDGSAAHWTVADGAMTVAAGGDIITRDSFENFQLHLEFRTPVEVKGEGQGRGNSGLFLQNRYELQILDSYNNATYSNGQAGAIYKQTAPLVNASRKPGEWQTYDVVYTAPVFSDKGTVIHPAYVTVFHNGVLVQNHTAIQGTTPYTGRGVYTPHGPAGIRLQDHGNPMSFRNVWVRRL